MTAAPARAEVLAAARAWLWVPETATRVETDEWLLVRYPDWFDSPFEVLRLEPGAATGDALDGALAGAADLGADRVTVWVRLDAPADLAGILEARGGVLDETVDVLARGLVDEVPDLAPPHDVEVRWQVDRGAARDAHDLAARVFGGAVPDDAELDRSAAECATDLAAGRGGTLVAYRGGQPVGTGGLTLADGVARLWGGGVVPEARGSGVYRALLAARLEHAVTQGAGLALVKGRVETSAPVLRRAGFAAYGQERSYRLTVRG